MSAQAIHYGMQYKTEASHEWESVEFFSAPHLGVHFHVQDWSRIGGFQLGKWGYQKSIDGFCDGKSHYNG